MPRLCSSELALSWLLILGGAIDAAATTLGDPAADPAPTASVAASDTSGQPAVAKIAGPSIQSSLGRYGDPSGFRAFLDAKGIDYGFTYIGEVLGNPSGGVKRGASYDGQLDASLDVDFDRLVGMNGLAFHGNVYQIHGRSISGNNLLDLFTVSTLEAYPSTRLYEAWLEQSFAGGMAAIRVGQIGADVEFFVSKTATVFFNPTFGAPAILANDLPSGGPTYPLAAPAARLKVDPTERLTLLAALFDGDPAGPYRPGMNSVNPQIRDLSGTLFRLQDPPFLLTEAAYTYLDKSGAGLPGTLKAGYLHHFGSFAATDRPASSGVRYRGDDGAYALIDQTLYRKPGTDDQGASMFLRAFALPSDRNLIDLYVDGGLAYKGLIASRPRDTFGVAFAYARVSPSVSRQDAQSGTPLIRDFQTNVEATYQYVVVPGFSIQPEFQYLFHPGAHGVADPRNGLPTRDAAVFGFRATVQY